MNFAMENKEFSNWLRLVGGNARDCDLRNLKFRFQGSFNFTWCYMEEKTCFGDKEV